MPSIWDAFTKPPGKEQEEAHSRALEKLKWLEEELKGKKLFGGEEIGMVDIVMGWLANLVSVFEEITGMKLIEKDNLPRLWGWRETFGEIPVVKENWPPRDKLVAKYHALRETFLSKESQKDN